MSYALIQIANATVTRNAGAGTTQASLYTVPALKKLLIKNYSVAISSVSANTILTLGAGVLTGGISRVFSTGIARNGATTIIPCMNFCSKSTTPLGLGATDYPANASGSMDNAVLVAGDILIFQLTTTTSTIVDMFVTASGVLIDA